MTRNRAQRRLRSHPKMRLTKPLRRIRNRLQLGDYDVTNAKSLNIDVNEYLKYRILKDREILDGKSNTIN